MDSLRLLESAASGMEAQRAALDVAARNVAAAQAAGPRGSFARLVPEFALVQTAQGATEIAYRGSHLEHGKSVDMIEEMVSVLNASRAYEANAAVFDIGKRIAERTIDMGKV